MLIRSLLENTQDKLPCVVYGGRFQPFHRGHYSAYKWLCKHFGKDAVWIATSNKTNFDPKKGDVSPLDFKERKEIIIRLYGVNDDHVVQCKNPAFTPSEVLEYYKGPTVLILACGAKDAERYEGTKFYQPYPCKGSSPLPFSQVQSKLTAVNGDEGVMYYLPVPMRESGVSGSKVRAELTGAPDKHVVPLFKKYFGRYDKYVRETLLARLAQVKSADEPKEEE